MSDLEQEWNWTNAPAEGAEHTRQRMRRTAHSYRKHEWINVQRVPHHNTRDRSIQAVCRSFGDRRLVIGDFALCSGDPERLPLKKESPADIGPVAHNEMLLCYSSHLC